MECNMQDHDIYWYASVRFRYRCNTYQWGKTCQVTWWLTLKAPIITCPYSCFYAGWHTPYTAVHAVVLNFTEYRLKMYWDDKVWWKRTLLKENNSDAKDLKMFKCASRLFFFHIYKTDIYKIYIFWDWMDCKNQLKIC